jgi:TRAP-type C4-dicarboxylate transport system substrate-binding protein
MTVSRRTFIATTVAGVAAPAVLRVAPANAAEVTLRLHHFLPAVSSVHKFLLDPWTKRIESGTGGRLKIDIYPSMQLGGAPPQLYDQAKDGVADIIWTLPGYTASRFPTTEVFELPFIASRQGIVNARAAQAFADEHLKEETKDVKLLSFWCHDHGLIHANRQVKTMEDLKGLKLRFPTRLAGEALKALGASPIGMPVPQVPESLAQKVLDGAVIPWEVVPAVKVHELVKYHTEIPGSPTFYTASFMLAMNPAKYNSLPADLKKVLDAESGMTFATAAGKMWDDVGLDISEMVRKRGNIITTIDESEKARWMKTTEPVADGWIKQMKERNLDGGKLIEAAKAALAKYEKA